MKDQGDDGVQGSGVAQSVDGVQSNAGIQSGTEVQSGADVQSGYGFQGTVGAQSMGNAQSISGVQNGQSVHGEQSAQNEQSGVSEQEMLNAAARTPSVVVEPSDSKMKAGKKSHKGLLIGILAGVGVVILAVVAVVVVKLVTKVDYREAFLTARELEGEIDSLSGVSCGYAVEDLRSTMSPIDYNKYTETCGNAAEKVVELMGKLKETDGVKRNKEIREEYDRFAEGLNQTVPELDKLGEKMKLLEAYHAYYAAEIGWGSTDEEFEAAAKPLIDSGNEEWSKFGREWLEQVKSTAQTYRDYMDATDYTETRELRQVFDQRKDEFEEWLEENKLDLAGIADLKFEHMGQLEKEYRTLFRLIADTYAENYTLGTGDCTELWGQVMCE